jgi:hypothetical protein
MPDLPNKKKPSTLTWEKSVMVKHPDSIQSSAYVNVDPFVASYEKVLPNNINRIFISESVFIKEYSG